MSKMEASIHVWIWKRDEILLSTFINFHFIDSKLIPFFLHLLFNVKQMISTNK